MSPTPIDREELKRLCAASESCPRDIADTLIAAIPALLAELEAMEAENFKLAAYQCKNPVSLEHGDMDCLDEITLRQNLAAANAEIERLKARIEELKTIAGMDKLNLQQAADDFEKIAGEEYDALASQLAAAKARIAELGEALSFYADRANWTTEEQVNVDEIFDTAMSADNHGDSARTTLSEVPDGWRPIETAPKDGTLILVSFGTVGVQAVSWSEPENSDFEIWCVDDRKFGPYALRGYCDAGPTAPTHWRPLPAPPAIKRKE